MTKLNERTAKWPIEERAFKIIKSRKSRKYIGTKESDFKIFPKCIFKSREYPKRVSIISIANCFIAKTKNQNFLSSSRFYFHLIKKTITNTSEKSSELASAENFDYK